MLLVQGCGSFGSSSKDESGSLKSEGAAVFTDNEALDIPDFESSDDVDDAFQWSIVLVTLPKPEMAPVVLNTVQTKFGLLSAYITERADKTVISYGKYTGPDDRRALLDLDRVREMQSDGSRPFAAAFLAPPSGDALSGKNAELDLRTVKERFGPAALYTLQIGVYGTVGQTNPSSSEIREFRASAEQAVSELREQGERAFYYHAPLRSTVTIGVFGDGDFDGSTTPAIESGRLKELRKRFPYNYLNGQGMRETITSSSGQRVTRLQPSSLVGIP
ncbi:MAG: hypothetical protein AB8C13_00295 [Phycisphaerales bacterium]